MRNIGISCRALLRGCVLPRIVRRSWMVPGSEIRVVCARLLMRYILVIL